MPSRAGVVAARVGGLAIGIAIAVACAGGGGSGAGATPGKAELVLMGGDVWTMDPARPRAEALAIAGGRIVAVGSGGEVATWIGPRTRVVTLDGKSVTPGLVDAHAHLHGLGHWNSMVALRGAKSEADAVARVVADAKDGHGNGGEWLQGRGWDQNLWTPPVFPTRGSLDAAVPTRPIVLRRVDGHAMWVSSEALARAGITRATVDPAGGKIERDAAGEPTGVLVDAAMDLVAARMPADPPALTEAKLLAGQAQALAAGLTGLHDMGVDESIVRAYRALDASGRLHLRIVAYVDGEKARPEDLAGQAPDRDDDGTRRFTLRGIKLFADGALGSRGAALLAPYADDPGNVGLAVTPPERLTALARAALAGGWQVATHAIGDRGNRATLDAYEAAGVEGKDVRFRLEHAQVLALDDIARLARLGVVASMQPTHATSDMGWADERLGPDRLAGAYAWRRVLASGARLAFGSDFPVEDVAPVFGLWAAVTRQDVDRKPDGGWLPDQRLTLDEAVAAFTTGAAWAVHQERTRGRLAVGYVADVTVFDRALLDGAALLDTTASLTIVGGEIVWDGASGGASPPGTR